jgi:hypothetical protein
MRLKRKRGDTKRVSSADREREGSGKRRRRESAKERVPL